MGGGVASGAGYAEGPAQFRAGLRKTQESVPQVPRPGGGDVLTAESGSWPTSLESSEEGEAWAGKKDLWHKDTLPL